MSVAQKAKKRSGKNEDTKLLEDCEKKGVGWLHDSGVLFFKNEFYPALKRLEKTASSLLEKEIIADSYYLLGDIYDFNHAPLAAIRAYKKGITFFPDPDYASGFHREIGAMYNNIGKYTLADRYFKKALKINPDDVHARSDSEFNRWDIEKPRCPLFVEGDWKWEVNELLANNKPEAALKKFPVRMSVRSCLIKSRCFSLLGDKDSQMKEWRNIQNLTGKFEFDSADLFFMRGEIYESLEFWEIMDSIKNRFKHTHASILRGDILRKKWTKKYGKLDWIKLEEDYISFNVAKFSQNVKRLKLLSKKYPKWIELIRELKKLTH